MSIKIFITLIASTLITSPCYAMEPKKPSINAAKMALVEKYGHIGYVIKQIETTYDTKGSINNLPLPNHVTDRIIEYVKLDLLISERIIPNPFTVYGLPHVDDKTLSKKQKAQKRTDYFNNKYYLSLAHNPCKPELAAGLTKKIVIWDLKNDKHAYSLTPPDHNPSLPFTNHLVYNPTGTQLASASNIDPTIHVWDLTTKNIIHSRELTDSIHALVFSHDGTKLIIGDFNKYIIWDIATNSYKSRPTQSIPCGTIRSPDGKTFASSIGPNITLWNLESVSEKTYPTKYPLNLLAFNHNGTQIVSTSNNEITAQSFNKPETESKFTLTLDNDKQIDGIAYCPQLNTYFVLTKSNTCSIISINPHNFIITSKKPLIPLNNHEVASRSKFNNNGDKFAQIISVAVPEASYIRYYDLAPDLNSYTIEELLRIKKQQETINKL